MPPLGFVTAFTRTRDGLGEPPDPFEDMDGFLDGWWDNSFVQQRESFEEPDDFVTFVTPDGRPEPEKVRSWDKQVQDILGPTSREKSPGRHDVRFDITGELNLTSWQTQYENARIPVKAMAKVPGTGFLMEPHAAKALAAMFDAARKDGVNLSIGNTYRDYATQAAMYQAHLNGDHPAPVASPGSSNHGWGLAVDVASVGDAEFKWLLNNAGNFGFTNPWIEGKGDRDSVEPWHWEYQGGGDTGSPPTRRRRKGEQQGEPATPAPVLVLDDLVDDTPAFGAVLASLMQSPTAPARAQPARSTSAARGSIAAQLRKGFQDAGRPDLAKMVGTDDFSTWIAAESGHSNWATNPAAVSVASQSFPGHGRNYGLFQFWEGHAWTDNYLTSPTSWTADAYTQAKLAARYFPHLGPNDIRNYAEQIRNGTYHGWG